MDLIYSTPMRWDGTNRICWKVSFGGIFEVKSFFFFINKKKIILMKDKQEKYKEFTVVNKGNRSSP